MSRSRKKTKDGVQPGRDGRLPLDRFVPEVLNAASVAQILGCLPKTAGGKGTAQSDIRVSNFK